MSLLIFILNKVSLVRKENETHSWSGRAYFKTSKIRRKRRKRIYLTLPSNNFMQVIPLENYGQNFFWGKEGRTYSFYIFIRFDCCRCERTWIWFLTPMVNFISIRRISVISWWRRILPRSFVSREFKACIVCTRTIHAASRTQINANRSNNTHSPDTPYKISLQHRTENYIYTHWNNTLTK